MLTGETLGPYRILEKLGEGGMGEVYQATDTNLKRSVAIKVLPASVAGDAERLARFQREAEVLAALNHPNIAAIYGLEKTPDFTALVMELVEGEDLSEKLKVRSEKEKGLPPGLPLTEALAIAKQIADALEAAHEQNIIHRDLKPANIKVRSDGTVKVLDFGLAKAMEPAGAASSRASMSPTLSLHATMAGVILGTAAYMAPEQARGKAVDKRADIWAFGVVLYEMLTGQRAFDGEDMTEVLGAVVRLEPNFDALPTDTPPYVRRVVQLCLRKDVRQRAQAMGDVRLALEGAFETAAPQTLAPGASPAPRRRLAWMAASTVAAVLAAALAVPAIRHLRETPPASPPEMRTDIVTPATSDPTSLAVSPDGRQIVFVAAGDSGSRLWLRPLNATTAQPLPGTDGAATPFWSPDSRSLAFFAGGQLKRLDIGGGAPQVLATQALNRGGSWNADGVILFSTTTTSPLFRVTAGGQPVPVTKLDRQTSHRCPIFLPDGRQFLFYAVGRTPDTAGIYIGSLDSPVTHRLTAANAAGGYLQSGWLLWVRAGTLLAQRLDLERRVLTGDPVTVADPVAFDQNVGAVSVSPGGLVAYRAGGGSRRQLAWFDRAGKALGTLGAPDDKTMMSVSVSPDAKKVAVSRMVQGDTGIWLLDGTHTSLFTFDPARDQFPIFSLNDSRIAFDSDRKGHRDLYLKSSSGVGEEELLVESAQDKVVTDWSADGRFLMFTSIGDPKTGYDLWVVPMAGDGKPWAFLNTPRQEKMGAFSPDGHWVAYMSNESGRAEIYVRPFAEPAASGAGTNAPAAQLTVSTTGGLYPRWRRDSTEIYYIGPNGEMMAARFTATGSTPVLGVPVTLFSTRIYGGGTDSQQGRQYDVTGDGRFLLNTVLDEASAPITLLQNWHPEAKK